MLSTKSRSGRRYRDPNCIFPIGSCRASRCCEPIAEERGAGNPHATFCGNRRRATASGDPVGVQQWTFLPRTHIKQRRASFSAPRQRITFNRDCLPEVPCRARSTALEPALVVDPDQADLGLISQPSLPIPEEIPPIGGMLRGADLNSKRRKAPRLIGLSQQRFSLFIPRGGVAFKD